MPKLIRKWSEVVHPDYDQKLDQFLKTDRVAWIPDEQTPRHRCMWHERSRQKQLFTRTIKVWSNVTLCGIHQRPIIRAYGYDSDCECDYECDPSKECHGCCCYRADSVLSKMRTVVIFRDDPSKMTDEQVKELLVNHQMLVRNDRGRFVKAVEL